MRKFVLRICLAVMLVQSLIFCPVSTRASCENSGDNAMYVDLAVDLASTIVAKFFAGQLIQLLKQLVNAIWGDHDPRWFPVFLSWNPAETISALGHAAVNKWMRDATKIAAEFTGEEGHVTDKWVGTPEQNTSVAILDDLNVQSTKFAAIAYNADNYAGVGSTDSRALMQHRSAVLLEDQRNLTNVAGENWGMMYRAQQRSIKALASALVLKNQLAVLAAADGQISAAYETLPQALNSMGTRKAMYDALMILKLNVMAARTKLRAEALEVDFRPLTEELDEGDDANENGNDNGNENGNDNGNENGNDNGNENGNDNGGSDLNLDLDCDSPDLSDTQRELCRYANT